MLNDMFDVSCSIGITQYCVNFVIASTLHVVHKRTYIRTYDSLETERQRQREREREGGQTWQPTIIVTTYPSTDCVASCTRHVLRHSLSLADIYT